MLVHVGILPEDRKKVPEKVGILQAENLWISYNEAIKKRGIKFKGGTYDEEKNVGICHGTDHRIVRSGRSVFRGKSR